MRSAEATKKMHQQFDSFGGFPMILPVSTWTGKNYTFDWQEVVIKMRRMIFANFPLDVYIYIDDLDANKHVIIVRK